MSKNHIWYVEAIVETPVIIRVAASNEQEAFARVMDGAWHGCDPDPKTWDKAHVKRVVKFKEGPGIST